MKDNFATLTRAFANQHTAVMETTDKQGKAVYLVCAIQQDSDEKYSIIPLAEMIDGNPFDLYNPPDFDASSQPPALATHAGTLPDDGQRAAKGPEAGDAPGGEPKAG